MGEKVYGLLGRKLGHSWSVPIHRALGCPDYRLWEVEPEDLPAFLSREDIGGLNVTIPYKRDVIPFCQELDRGAQAIGSVNTLVRGADGRLRGYNTDLVGFLTMARRAGIPFAGRKVLVLGSGGASLTVQAAARMEGAGEVAVISRTGPDNYENLRERHGGAQILVNATPAGMWPQVEEQPVDLALLPRLEGVLDLIYNPLRTNLLLQAQALGLPCSGGLPMLVEQAAARCDLLHLFVVTEDASLVPFYVRYRLVQEGVAHLPNVMVHQTGSYMISSSTFPSYFIKDDGDVIQAQARLDLQIFLRIAAALGISARFVGEEPFSQVTAVYNRIMKEELEKNGLSCIILPRKAQGDAPISASAVRRLIHSGDLEAIRPLVPESTYRFFLSPEGEPVVQAIRAAGEDQVTHY